jgi:hypothetical protein
MMLFFGGEAESKDASGIGGTTQIYTAQGALAQLKESWDALGTFVIPKSETAIKNFVDIINQSVIAQESLTKSLQRSMGGVITGAEEFTEKFRNVYYGIGDARDGVIEMGATFKDTIESVEGLASSMGRMVNPSEDTVYNMVALSKATGESSKAIGTMVGEMTRYGFTQLGATEKLHDFSVEARKSGLSAKGYMSEINKNMKSVSGFGFKSGVDGMAKMVKQAMLLRTNVESIGAKKLQDTVLDPEGAIQMAADFQMLGGAVGKLSDPFQLMHMAQTDMEGLQNELVNSAKAATTFNKATGKFDVSTQDMYRLRKQAELTGANLEDLVNTGKEAAKMDYIKDKFDLTSVSKGNQEVLAGLSEIGANGEVRFDLPGFDEQGKTLEEILKDGTRKTALDKALTEYEKNAGLSEKDLAIKQMTISDTQARDINIIKETIMRNLTKEDRQKLEESIVGLTKETGKKSRELANSGSPLTKELPDFANRAASGATAALPSVIDPATESLMRTLIDSAKSTIFNVPPEIPMPTEDLFLGANNSVPKIMSKGTLYKGIVGDEVAMGTNLSDAINKGGGGSGGGTVDGKIDININLTGAISGDKSGDIEKMFADPRIQKQLMDTVLYKLDNYKRQQGVLS